MFNSENFFARPFELTLTVDEAAIDWGYVHDEAKRPEKVPYFCELSAYYTPHHNHADSAVITTKGIVYPTFRDGNFTGWNLASFEPDYADNCDIFDTAITQDNRQGYAYTCEGENLDDTHAQMAANALDKLIAELPMQSVTIEYVHVFVNLVTPENYPSE